MDKQVGTSRVDWMHDALSLDLDHLMNACREGIFICDENLVGIKMNVAYDRITGMTKEDLLGKKVTSLVEQGIISESVCEQVQKRGRPVSIMQKFKSGKVCLVTGTPVFDDFHQLRYVVVTARDVTEINQLKAELEEAHFQSEVYLHELSHLKAQFLYANHIVAKSVAMKNLLDTAARIATVESPVILLGESGVGKDVLAKYIHESSHRSSKPFIKVNCGAIPAELLESELFGYKTGAFTGASRTGKAGMFEVANGGTIFLDEIGELPLPLQVKLLQVLQDYRITRVGDTTPIPLDIRIITATNRSLETMMKEKTFREDLYYRIHVIPLHVPPLRERKEDIAPLIHYTLMNLAKKYNQKKTLSLEALECLEEYDWPGNVRELQNTIERLFVMVDALIIEASHLPFTRTAASMPEDASPLPLKQYMEQIEKKFIRKTLEKHPVMRDAAKVLAIDPATLTRKCQKYQIKIGKRIL
ncbi:sigma 54-interacting transcriptional regulator [Aneurinibacillus sp. BA2021]|nr:sigma 54-interacting transcriptional regulator [Aneurinibacillus sp. BA2021]